MATALQDIFLLWARGSNVHAEPLNMMESRGIWCAKNRSASVCGQDRRIESTGSLEAEGQILRLRLLIV